MNHNENQIIYRIYFTQENTNSLRESLRNVLVYEPHGGGIARLLRRYKTIDALEEEKNDDQ